MASEDRKCNSGRRQELRGHLNEGVRTSVEKTLRRAPNNSHCVVAAFGFIFATLRDPRAKHLATFLRDDNHNASGDVTLQMQQG